MTDTKTPGKHFQVRHIRIRFIVLFLSLGYLSGASPVPPASAQESVSIVPGDIVPVVRVSDEEKSFFSSGFQTGNSDPQNLLEIDRGLLIRVNFQPSGSWPPAGFLIDIGQVFGNRIGGYRFGWNSDNQANARERNSPNSPDEQSDTFIELPDGDSSSWEIELPNGSYRVRIVAGDPLTYESSYQINVEETVIIDGRTSDNSRWLAGDVLVDVRDGRLTVSNGAGVINNKINYIEITAVMNPVATHSTYIPVLLSP